MSSSASSWTPPPDPGPVRVELAVDRRPRQEASDLVDRRYYLDLGLSPPEGARELAPQQTWAVVARGEDGRVVATLSLTSAAFGAPGEPPRAFELESSYQFDSLGVPRACLAEVNRVAALPGQRRAVLELYAFARRVCLASGVHSWLGLVEAGNSLDAAAVLRTAYACGLTSHPLPLRTRVDSPLYRELRESAAPFADVVQTPEVPHRVAQFAADLRARVVGIPSRHPVYSRRLVVPMLADLRRPFPFEPQEA